MQSPGDGSLDSVPAEIHGSLVGPVGMYLMPLLVIADPLDQQLPHPRAEDARLTLFDINEGRDSHCLSLLQHCEVVEEAFDGGASG